MSILCCTVDSDFVGKITRSHDHEVISQSDIQDSPEMNPPVKKPQQ